MEEPDQLEALLRWAAENGVTDSPACLTPPPHSSSCLGRSLIVSYFPNGGGRGLAAARDLRKGELVLRVPRAALLTRESVLRNDVKLASLFQRHPRLSSTLILTVCLLFEVGKGKSSWWHPYLVKLPSSYDTLPNFSQFEIQALQIEDAKWIAEKAASKAQSDWKEAISLMQEMGLRSELLTFTSWIWASATISSRTLHIPWDDAGCLCPVGDLFNYAAPEEEHLSDVSSSLRPKNIAENLEAQKPDDYSQRLTDGGYEDETESYCFYAKRSYRRGEQVLLGYGTYTNLDLLEHYGFLLDVNTNDKAFIPLDPGIYTASSWPRDSLYIQPDGSPSFALLCALRIWATPLNLRRAVGHAAYTGSLLSVENELHVLKWMAEHCLAILAAMPTTIQDDNLLLQLIVKMLDQRACLEGIEVLFCRQEVDRFFQANRLSKQGFSTLPKKAMKSLLRWKLAVEWRLGQKNMLHNCSSYCNRTIESFCLQKMPGKKSTIKMLL